MDTKQLTRVLIQNNIFTAVRGMIGKPALLGGENTSPVLQATIMRLFLHNPWVPEPQSVTAQAEGDSAALGADLTMSRAFITENRMVK